MQLKSERRPLISIVEKFPLALLEQLIQRRSIAVYRAADGRGFGREVCSPGKRLCLRENAAATTRASAIGSIYQGLDGSGDQHKGSRK